MAVPTASEFEAFLIDAGVASDGDFTDDQLNAMIAAAEAEFLRSCGWAWMESTAVTDRAYIITKPISYWVVPQSAILTLTTLKCDDVTLVLDQDFFLRPDNGTFKTAVEFNGFAYGQIKITGTMGAFATYPTSVKNALMAQAGLDMLAKRDGAYGDVNSIKQGPVSFSFASPDAQESMIGAASSWSSLVRREVAYWLSQRPRVC